MIFTGVMDKCIICSPSKLLELFDLVKFVSKMDVGRYIISQNQLLGAV